MITENEEKINRQNDKDIVGLVNSHLACYNNRVHFATKDHEGDENVAVRIITDSASDILPAQAEALGIRVLPLRVYFGKTEFRDGIDIEPEEFFDKIEAEGVFPKTSQVTPFDFEEAFEEAVDEGDDVVCITLSSELSGCFQSANIAAVDYVDHVYTIDSRNVTLGEKLLVMEAVRLRDEGWSADEIAERLEEIKGRIKLIALLDTLEYLKRGGRISGAVALAGAMLKIKPIAIAKEGKIVQAGKARGSVAACAMVNKLIGELGGIDPAMPYTIGACGRDRTLVNSFIQGNAVLEETSREVPEITRIGAGIGTYAGPGAIGIAFFAKETQA